MKRSLAPKCRFGLACLFVVFVVGDGIGVERVNLQQVFDLPEAKLLQIGDRKTALLTVVQIASVARV